MIWPFRPKRKLQLRSVEELILQLPLVERELHKDGPGQEFDVPPSRELSERAQFIVRSGGREVIEVGLEPWGLYTTVPGDDSLALDFDEPMTGRVEIVSSAGHIDFWIHDTPLWPTAATLKDGTPAVWR